jgi:hypothetical protein
MERWRKPEERGIHAVSLFSRDRFQELPKPSSVVTLKRTKIRVPFWVRKQIAEGGRMA